LALASSIHCPICFICSSYFGRSPSQSEGDRLGKVQIRKAKEVIWEILAVDQHGIAMIQRSKAGNKRAALDAANE